MCNKLLANKQIVNFVAGILVRGVGFGCKLFYGPQNKSRLKLVDKKYIMEVNSLGHQQCERFRKVMKHSDHGNPIGLAPCNI